MLDKLSNVIAVVPMRHTVIVGGDFNMSLSPLPDRVGPNILRSRDKGLTDNHDFMSSLKRRSSAC